MELTTLNNLYKDGAITKEEFSKAKSILLQSKNKEEEKNKIEKNFDLSPRGIRELLGMNKPIYETTSAYGHFGRKPTDKGDFSWEKTDKTSIFKL